VIKRSPAIASAWCAKFYYWAPNGKLLRTSVARVREAISRHHRRQSAAPSRFAIDRRPLEASSWQRSGSVWPAAAFVSELHMYAYRRVYGIDVEVKAVAAGATCLDLLGGTRYRSVPQLSRLNRRRRARCCRHLHAPNLHTSMISCDAGRQHVCAKTICGLFRNERRQGADRQARPQTLMYDCVLEEWKAPARRSARLAGSSCMQKTGLRAGGDKTVEILRATKDKICS